MLVILAPQLRDGAMHHDLSDPDVSMMKHEAYKPTGRYAIISVT